MCESLTRALGYLPERGQGLNSWWWLVGERLGPEQWQGLKTGPA